jgi:Holliday junction DNA helicase RuvA
MIAFLRGIPVFVGVHHVILDVNGVGYQVQMTVRDSQILAQSKNQEVQVHIYHLISDRTQKLYGFLKEDEKEVFLLLTSFHGIGEMTAIKVLSFVSPEDLKRIAETEDIGPLNKIPKVRGKTAEKIGFELKSNRKKLERLVRSQGTSATTQVLEDDSLGLAILALLELGFDAKSAEEKATRHYKNGTKDASSLVRACLSDL